MITRFVDWRARLQAYLEGGARREFAFGTHDCALFAADALAAMTGVDLGERYRGRYSTMQGGLRLMVRDGFADHVALFRAHLPSGPVARALPGDLAVIETPDGLSLGVVQGAMIYCLQPSGVLGLVPLSDAIEVLTV